MVWTEEDDLWIMRVTATATPRGHRRPTQVLLLLPLLLLPPLLLLSLLPLPPFRRLHRNLRHLIPPPRIVLIRCPGE